MDFGYLSTITLKFASNDRKIWCIFSLRPYLKARSIAANDLIYVWEMDKTQLELLRSQIWDIQTLACSDDDRLLAISSKIPFAVRILDSSSGDLLQELGFEEPIWGLSFRGRELMVDTRGELYRVNMLDPEVAVIERSVAERSGPKTRLMDNWIYKGQEPLVLLPPDYHGACWTEHDGKLFIGTESGNIVFIKVK